MISPPKLEEMSQFQPEALWKMRSTKLDELVKIRNPIEFAIPAKAGIQLFQDVLDPGACPGPDPGFAGVTTLETFYEIITIAG
jgi:hypothetical protein